MTAILGHEMTHTWTAADIGKWYDEGDAVFQAFPDLFLRLDSSGIILGSRSPSNSEIFRPGTDFTGRPLAEMFPAEVTAALQGQGSDFGTPEVAADRRDRPRQAGAVE